MPDIRGAQNKKNLQTPTIKLYSIKRDTAFTGYKVLLNWDYNFQTDIVGFKVYRALLSTSRIERNYILTQKALEKLTAIKAFPLENTTLFNKSFVVQNSKVKVFNSGSTRVQKNELTDIAFDFVEIGFVKANKGQKLYQFLDRGIRFGETYVYVLSAVSKQLLESNKSVPLQVNIEDIENPDPPSYVKITQVLKGLLLNIGVDTGNDVAYFEVWRRKENEKQFKKLERIKADLPDNQYIDRDILPGDTCFYRVYTIDFFENYSFSGKEASKLYDERINGTTDVNFPQFKMFVDSGEVKFKGFLNDNKVVGYRFERQDVWRFEKGFNLKTYNGNPWENCVFFDDTFTCDFIDKTARLDRIYRYRITSIMENGEASSVFVTPNLRITEALKFENTDKLDTCEDCGKTKFQSFDVKVLDKRQRPLFTKFDWKINGRWGYLVIETQDKKYVVDNIHNFFYSIDFLPGQKYTVKAKLYDVQGRFLDETGEIKFNL